jgi:hypothetical protein
VPAGGDGTGVKANSSRPVPQNGTARQRQKLDIPDRWMHPWRRNQGRFETSTAQLTRENHQPQNAILSEFETPRRSRGGSVGEWLSLVEHLVRDQGVGGSNPLSPTNIFKDITALLDFRLHRCSRFCRRSNPQSSTTRVSLLVPQPDHEFPRTISSADGRLVGLRPRFRFKSYDINHLPRKQSPHGGA